MPKELAMNLTKLLSGQPGTPLRLDQTGGGHDRRVHQIHPRLIFPPPQSTVWRAGAALSHERWVLVGLRVF